MKKILSALAIGLSFASVAFAAPTNNGYFSTQHPAANLIGAKANLRHFTDITIRNFSSSVIYANVPNSPINDVVYPNNNDHIYSDVYDGAQVMLRDPYNAVFFNQYVCRYAFVDIYGYPGSYHVNIDETYC